MHFPAFGLTSVGMRENSDQNNSEYGHFSRSSMLLRMLCLNQSFLPKNKFYLREKYARKISLSCETNIQYYQNPLKLIQDGMSWHVKIPYAYQVLGRGF